MIVEYVRYTVDDARAAAFVDAYCAAGQHLLASPYCERFEIARCEEEPDSFIVRIEWTSTEDHLERFRGSAQFKSFFMYVKPYIGDLVEMRHYDVLEQLSRE